MASRNHTELIKDKSKRTLTAKGNSFVWKCLDIIAKLKSTHRYSKDFKDVQIKFKSIIYDLIIDKGMSISDIIELIKSRQYIK